MSYSRYVHVGPYLECRVEIVDTVRQHLACSKPGCPRSRPSTSYYPGRDHSKFCVDCGSPMRVIDVPAEEPRVNNAEAAETIKEALHYVDVDADGSEDFIYWLPNAHRDPPRAFAVKDDMALDLSDNHRASNEVIWFNNAFARENAVLCGLYGEGNTKTRWGVVAYTN